MSASDERMVDAAIAQAKELTAHQLTDSHSPPVSPAEGGSSAFFDDDSPGLLSKLKNSIKRNGGHEESRQRTFSEELENKGDLDDEVTPEAQQAYNMLVVKGSFKENKQSAPVPAPAVRPKPEISAPWTEDRSSAYRNESVVPTPPSRQQPHQQQQQYSNSSANWTEPDLIRDSKRGVTPPRVSAPIAISSPIPKEPAQAPVPASRPTISAPMSPPPPVPVKATPPVPAPRPVVKTDSTKRSEIPVPRPRPEIQRVEPTIRTAPPASPDIAPKKIESHIPVPAAKEREREELKRTIEIVRVTDTDSGSLRDDLSDRAASTSFDRSSARSSQRSSLDRSDNLSENAESERADWEQSECSSDSSNHRRFGGGGGFSSDFERGDHRGISGSSYTTTSSSSSTTAPPVERKDSLTKKQGGITPSSLFEEDLSEPSPQEIMSKLRERRLNRQIDHQRALASAGGGGDGMAEPPPPAITRNRPSAREPQGIPGRAPSVDLDEGSGGGGDSGQPDEVDTNPLRMLRGGAIPIRTAGGRASASGTGNHGNPEAAVATTSASAALRVPLLNFSSSSPLCRTSDGETEVAEDMVAACSATPSFSAQNLEKSTEGPGTDVTSPEGCAVSSAPAAKVSGEAVAAAELSRELELLTSTLMEGDLTKVASAVVDTAQTFSGSRPQSSTTVEGELDKFSSSGGMLKFDPVGISATTASCTQVTSAVVTTMSAMAAPQNAASVVSSSMEGKVSSVQPSPVSATDSPEKPTTLLLRVKPTLLPTAASPTADDSSDSSDDDVWVKRTVTASEDCVSEGKSKPAAELPGEPKSTVLKSKEKSPEETKPESEEERVTPPRLPPRRSMSLSENPEQDGRVTRSTPGVRRSGSSVQDVDTENLPALPPREPQPWRTPLNARPRERKFPLLVHPQASSSPLSHPNTPSPPTSATSSPRRVPQNCPIYNTPRSSHRSPESLGSSPGPIPPRGSSLNANGPPPPRPARLSPNSLRLQVSPHQAPPRNQNSLATSPLSHSGCPSPSDSMSPTSPNLHFLHASDTTGSVELPPTYDLSISPEFDTAPPCSQRDESSRDREPTHMLLNPHASHRLGTKLPPRRHIPPPLAVSLPPSKDLTISDEPTHVSLSSLAHNKLSWSSSFPSPSPLSPSFQQHIKQASRASPSDASTHLSQSNSSVNSPHFSPRSISRSCSHTYGKAPPHRAVHLSEPEVDNQSPPADLPPAPPTPSYRHRLGLDAAAQHQGKPTMVRSFSHNPAVSGRGSPNFVYGDSGGQLLSVDLHADRVASPSFRHQRYLTPSPLPSSSPTTQQVFPPSPYLRNDNNTNSSSRGNMGFFADAPSVPHPYSQTPFHPITTSSSSSDSATSQSSATIYSSIVPQAPAPVSQSLSPPPPPRNLPHRVLSQPAPSPSSTALTRPDPQVTLSRTPPPLSPPRTSSHAVMRAYSSSRGASLSPPPRPPPLGSTPADQRPALSSTQHQQPSLPSMRPQDHQIFQFPASSCSSSSVNMKTPHLNRTNAAAAAAAARPTHSLGLRGLNISQDQEREDEDAEVSPLMFAGFSATSSASYEDLQQFSLER